MEAHNIFIDSHVHAWPRQRLSALLRWIKRGFPEHPVSLDITKEQIISDLQDQNVTHFFNLVYPLDQAETDSLNDWNLDFCAATPGAIPFGGMHPDTPDKPAVAEKLIERGAVGIKFHPFVQRFDPWDQRLDPLYAFLEEAQRPLVIHTGFELFYNMAMPPAQLRKLLSRYPALPVVFVHMLFPDLNQAFEMLGEFPNLYLDATNVLASLRPRFKPMLDQVPGGKKIPDLLARGITNYQGRIMYGSDHPAGIGTPADIYNDLTRLAVDESAIRSMTSLAPMAFIERFLPNFDWDRRLTPLSG